MEQSKEETSLLRQIIDREEQNVTSLEDLELQYLNFEVDDVAIQLTSNKDEDEEKLLVNILDKEIQTASRHHQELDQVVNLLNDYELNETMKKTQLKVARAKAKYRQDMLRLEQHSARTLRRLNDESRMEWRRLEDKMRSKLKSIDTKVIVEADSHWNDHGKYFDKKQWSIKWKREPQILNFDFHRISSILGEPLDVDQDERMVLSVSMYDRLNGFEIGFSKLGTSSKRFKRVFFLNRKDNKRKFACTKPIYQSTDKTIVMSETSLQFVCPCNQEMHPRMIIALELFSLTRNNSVAWGVFPAVNSDLSCLHDGHYKCALMRGELNKKKVDTYFKWFNMSNEFIFGNIYFHVHRVESREIYHNESINSINTTYSLEVHHDSKNDKIQRVVLSHSGEVGRYPQKENTTEPYSSIALQQKNDIFSDVLGIESTSMVGPPVIDHNEIIDFSLYKQSVRSEEHSWSKLPLYYEKAIYLYRTLLFDLGFQSFKTLETYLMVLLCLVIMYVRYWPHYLAQWVYLGAGKIPTTDPTYWRAWHVSFHFRPEYCTALYVVGYTYIGSLFNIILFVLLGLTIFLFQSKFLFGTLPIITYRIVLLYGFCIIGDPLWIFISDLIFLHGQPIGEAYSLSIHYMANNASLLPGLFLTLFIYAQTAALASLVVYQYSLRIHIHGRVWDIYHRLHATESELIMHDDEYVRADTQDEKPST